MTPRQKLSLLSGAAIVNADNVIRAHPADIEESVALGGRAIGGDRLAFRLGARKKIQETLFTASTFSDEARITFDRIETRCALGAAHRLQARRRRTSRAFAAHEKAQGAAMRRQFLDVESDKTVRGQNALHRHEREIGKVLVIDRVELQFADEVQDVRKFEGRDAARLENFRKSGDEFADIGNMRQHIVGRSEIGGKAPRRQFAGRLFAEKGDFRRHAFGARRLRDIGRRLDPSTGTPRAIKCCSR